MNKWDCLFGGIAFMAGYLCRAWGAPLLLTVIVAAAVGTSWGAVSNFHEYRRAYRKGHRE